ncbi:MAG: exopolysaccharide Pel transporter PelG, partial [Pseudomonadota bacterium]|nr:exopolysaccharide Pel transporter PelG [Pseudomonadota bacterium]
LTQRDDLSGALQAFTAAAAITSGPWLLTVLAIAGSGLGMAVATAAPEYQSFRVILSYDFCFSLVLTAPATTLASRLVADQLFAGKVDEIVPTFLATLAMALALQMPLALLCWFEVIDLPGMDAAAAVAGYAALVLLWVTTAFLSVLRDFGFVLACFVLGMAVACGGSLWASQAFGAAGMLAWFATGIALVGFAGAGRLMSRFAYGALPLEALVAAARRNRVLLLIGLLSAAAPWADKWVMWFGPLSERLSSGLRHAPSYDSAMFLAYLAMVPGSAAFFVIAETGFFLSYRRFFDEVLSGATLSRIESQRSELCGRIADAGVSLILLQGIVTVTTQLAGPSLIQAGVLTALQYPIFRFGVLGAQFHLLLNCLLVVMSYLDLRADQVSCASSFLFLNVLLVAGLLPFGFGWDGYGYFLAALLAFLIAAAMTASRCRDLIYVAFIRNNASVRDAR